MAEKYGTIPKRFTKAWWEYFWLYYKWYVIIPALIIAAIVSTVYSNITAPKYDVTLTYAGKNVFSEDSAEKLTAALSPLCEDIDGNGEKALSFVQLHISNDSVDPQYDMAMNTKLQLAFAEDETYIFILDEENAMRYVGEKADDCVYAPLDDWLSAEISDNDIFSAHGKRYGVNLSEHKLFKDMGMDLSDHYLFIRYYPRKDQIEKQLDGYNAAIKLANSLLSK
jgi:hypothetical protein